MANDLENLFKVVEASAKEALEQGFVANLMTTGTDTHAAIECGTRIGIGFRGKVLAATDPRRENPRLDIAESPQRSGKPEVAR